MAYKRKASYLPRSGKYMKRRRITRRPLSTLSRTRRYSYAPRLVARTRSGMRRITGNQPTMIRSSLRPTPSICRMNNRTVCGSNHPIVPRSIRMRSDLRDVSDSYLNYNKETRKFIESLPLSIRLSMNDDILKKYYHPSDIDILHNARAIYNRETALKQQQYQDSKPSYVDTAARAGAAALGGTIARRFGLGSIAPAVGNIASQLYGAGRSLFDNRPEQDEDGMVYDEENPYIMNEHQMRAKHFNLHDEL